MNLKSNKAISLTSLVFAIMIMLLIAGTLLYNSNNGVKIRALNNMYQDIEVLQDKVKTYHAKNGKLPLLQHYTNTSMLNAIKNPNDNDQYYVIDLEAIENLSLNYGKDYSKIKGVTGKDSEYTDLYIVNEQSQTVYYPKGIKLENVIYYKDKEDYTQVALELKPGQIAKENTEYMDSNKDTAMIPKGFMISEVAAEQTVQDGLVIKDANGNEFVWIPVTNSNVFERRDGYNNGSLQNVTDYGEADNTGTNSKVAEDAITQAEARAMYTSVDTNGGFYIGRYEAGKENEKVVVKKNAAVYNYIKWGNSMTDSKGGAVEKARNFILQQGHDTTKVHSTLCYSVQWDTALNFMDPGYLGYAKDSTGKGNYSGSMINTGSNDTYKVKNIYDMAGNVMEWTMESYNINARICRGGSYNFTGIESPVSSRSSIMPSGSYGNIGFRVALYIK